MAAPRKDRTNEIQSVFENLKYCSVDELKRIIEKANVLIQKNKEAAIRQKEEAIAELQKQIDELRKD